MATSEGQFFSPFPARIVGYLETSASVGNTKFCIWGRREQLCLILVGPRCKVCLTLPTGPHGGNTIFPARAGTTGGTTGGGGPAGLGGEGSCVSPEILS